LLNLFTGKLQRGRYSCIFSYKWRVDSETRFG
jgi:hypothetical protein